jgi:hypothetical protein
MPAATASGCEAATMPRWLRTGDRREVNSISITLNTYLSVFVT